jgi:anti-anti-sigma factor
MSQLEALFNLLADVTSRLAEVTSVGALARRLCELVSEMGVADDYVFYAVDPGGTLRIAHAVGLSPEDQQYAERTAMDRHPGWVLRNARPFYMGDLDEVAARIVKDSVHKVPIRSRLYVPVLCERRCVGMLGMVSRRAHAFSEAEINALTVACGVAGVVWKHLQDQDELRRHLARIEAQQDELLRLASPVIQVWRDVLVVPVIGAVDAARAERVSERLLGDIGARRARAVILDLTGVESIDAAGATHLLRICQAVALLGCRAVISGISPALAALVIEQGIDLGRVESHGSLQQALARLIA